MRAAITTSRPRRSLLATTRRPAPCAFNSSIAFSRPDRLLAAALRLANQALAERASAADLEELAAVVAELDEAIVVEGEPLPKRWHGRVLDRAARTRGTV